MTTDPPPSAMPWRGAALGATLGLAIFVTWSVLASPVAPNSVVIVDPTRASNVGGGAQVLGDAGPLATEKVGARTMSLLYVIQARLRSDDFNGAMKLVDAATTHDDRDFLLTNVGDRTLRSFDANTGTARSYVDDEGGTARVAQALPRLRKVVDAFHDDCLKVRYLVRLETAQFLLNGLGPEAQPASPAPVEPMLEEATALARNIRPEASAPAASPVVSAASTGSGFHLPWDRGILLTGLLGVLGFFASSLAEPMINAYGQRIASVVERRLKGPGHAGAVAVPESPARPAGSG